MERKTSKIEPRSSHFSDDECRCDQCLFNPPTLERIVDPESYQEMEKFKASMQSWLRSLLKSQPV